MSSAVQDRGDTGPNDVFGSGSCLVCVPVLSRVRLGDARGWSQAAAHFAARGRKEVRKLFCDLDDCWMRFHRYTWSGV